MKYCASNNGCINAATELLEETKTLIQNTYKEANNWFKKDAVNDNISKKSKPEDKSQESKKTNLRGGAGSTTGGPSGEDPNKWDKNKKKDWSKNTDGRWHHPNIDQFEGIANKPNSLDPKLDNIYNQLWRPNDTIPGGSAHALRYEVKNGLKLEHLQKVENRLSEILKRIDHADRGILPLSRTERLTADRVANDLKDAISKARNIRRGP
jgi:hypothetical protein